MIEIFVIDASSLVSPDQDRSNIEFLLIVPDNNNMTPNMFILELGISLPDPKP